MSQVIGSNWNSERGVSRDKRIRETGNETGFNRHRKGGNFDEARLWCQSCEMERLRVKDLRKLDHEIFMELEMKFPAMLQKHRLFTLCRRLFILLGYYRYFKHIRATFLVRYFRLILDRFQILYI